MISFCKSGMLVLEDSHGVLHYIDPNYSLRDVAAYIWKNETLNQYKVETQYLNFSHKRSKYIDKVTQITHRLRSSSSLKEDHYFNDIHELGAPYAPNHK